jgi:hypothetical protein
MAADPTTPLVEARLGPLVEAEQSVPLNPRPPSPPKDAGWKPAPENEPGLGLPRPPPRRRRRNGKPVIVDGGGAIDPPQPLAHLRLDDHQGKPAPKARRPLLPEDHAFGLNSVIWALLVCIPFASGLFAIACGLAAAIFPPRGRDEDRLLGLLGVVLGTANLGWWVWGMRH